MSTGTQHPHSTTGRGPARVPARALALALAAVTLATTAGCGAQPVTASGALPAPGTTSSLAAPSTPGATSSTPASAAPGPERAQPGTPPPPAPTPSPSSDPASGGAPAAPAQADVAALVAATPQPPYAGLPGPLEGLECSARVSAARGSAITAHWARGARTVEFERRGALGFEPVLLASGGDMGDVGGGMAAYVATDHQGRLHYLELSITRGGGTQAPAVSVSTDVVLGEGYGDARALGASVAFHAGGDPEVFVVDGAGRLMRRTLAAAGRALTLSAPTQLADGLTGVSAMSVETFDTDGDLAQERDAATRVLLVDGDRVRQMIVRRDGGHDALLSLLGPSEGLAGARALTRMWCARPGGAMADQGALVAFRPDGVGVVYAGTYTPAVAAPRLTRVGVLQPAIAGRLAG